MLNLDHLENKNYKDMSREVAHKEKEEKRLEVERQKQEKELLEAQQKESNWKQFEDLRSICLDCENAFVYNFMLHVERGNINFLIVVCKISQFKQWGHPYEHECFENVWYRKCTECSDFKQKEKAK